MTSQSSARLSNATVWFAKAGSAAYVVWALLHIQAAWAVYELGQNMPLGMERGRVLQNAWNLLCFALIAGAAAIGFNWRNDVRGWWINLVAVSATDIGFIIFVLAPGYMPWWPGLLGPVFWILGLGLSTTAILREKNA
ncbi:hypothetical protein [Bradyrhizobium sp. USDA 4520]